MDTLPNAPIGRIMKKAGAERVTNGAVATLTEILSEIVIHITERSVLLAEHAKRKTVTAEDVALAKYEIWG